MLLGSTPAKEVEMVGSQAPHPFGSRLSSWDAQRLGSRAHLQASMWEDGELNSSGEACMDLSLACGQRGEGPRRCAGGREGGLLQGTVRPLTVEEAGSIEDDVLFDSSKIHHFRSWNQDYNVIARAPSYGIGYDTYPNTKLILSLGLGDQIID